jgi:transposase-like protein
MKKTFKAHTTPTNCPRCQQRLEVVNVAPSPSPKYEARAFECEACGFRYTARVDRDAPNLQRSKPSQ